MARSPYRESGVDVEAADRLASWIQPLARTTRRAGVLPDVGAFGGLFALDSSRWSRPVLVASADGVGTKLRIAFLAGRHDTVGIDLVAMNVNDIAVLGAEPLFFLDYFATGKLDPVVARTVLEGIAAGCREAGCALLGGETAEMPSFYPPGEYDLAGFAVGAAEHDQVVDGHMVRVGDRLVGLASSGLHSNGFSLVRSIVFDKMRLKVSSPLPGLGASVAEELLRPTRIYAKTLLKLRREFHLHGMAHITGGGIPGKLPKVLPARVHAVLDLGSWPWPPIFRVLQEAGGIERSEMLRTFNCGLGVILIVPPREVDSLLERARGLGERGFLIGEIGERKHPSDPPVRFL